MVLAPALVVFSPFVAFYQRLALADSLFLLETVLAAWLGLRLALDVADGKARLPHTLLLGVVIGAAMLTRQSISYMLWLLPLLALVALWAGARPNRAVLLRWTRQIGMHLLLAVLVATVVWLPMLLAPGYGGFWEKVFNSSRFVEQLGPVERLARFLGNVPLLLEWYSIYLTPVMLALGTLSLLWLVRRGHRSLAFFLCGWFLLMVFPLLYAGTRLYPRYFLYGAVPLLIAGGLALSEGLGALLRRAPGWRGYAAAAGAGALLLALPGESLGQQLFRPHGQPLAPVDRWQYRDGWPAGYGSQAAVRVLQDLARRGPIIVVTWDSWGTPSDAVWVSLKDNPNVTLYCTERRDGAILGPALGPNEYLLADNKWSREPGTPTRLPAGVPVYYVNRVTSNTYGLPPDLVQFTPRVAGRQELAALNPGIREVASVPNGPADTPPEQVDEIAVFRLR
jgi:4-amino-4-deoxy-L-arabinose transferase-like glycosyltransferase